MKIIRTHWSQIWRKNEKIMKFDKMTNKKLFFSMKNHQSLFKTGFLPTNQSNFNIFSFSLQICDQWDHAVLLSYRTLNSDDFHFFTLLGWVFQKSKFKLKFSTLLKNLNFFCLFYIWFVFAYIFQWKAHHINFPKKAKIDPLYCIAL